LLTRNMTRIAKTNSIILLDAKNLEVNFNGWESFLDEVDDKEVIEILCRRTKTGVPCGDENFI
jgi:hypothetical protein